MDKATLRPCPFCGRHGYAIPLDPDYEKTRWQVECAASLCPANPSVEADTREEAIAAWNRRTPDAKLVEALKNFVALGEQEQWDEALTGRNVLLRQAREVLREAGAIQ